MINLDNVDVENKRMTGLRKAVEIMLTDDVRRYNEAAAVLKNELLEMDEEAVTMMNEEKMLAKNKAEMMKESGFINRWDKEMPAYICSLVNKVLDVKTGNVVAEINCGKGDYLKHTAAEYPAAKLVGVEKEAAKLELAVSRLNTSENVDINSTVMSDILNRNTPKYEHQINMCQANPFYYYNGFAVKGIYDKAFSYMSERIRLREERAFGEYMRDSRLYHVVRYRSTSDWYFNEMLIKSIKENGKAVALMNSGNLSNRIDDEARRFFVENGYVEAVIKLPERLAMRMRSMTLVVLSHGNKDIRFVDAGSCFVDGRRSKELSTENIDKIMAMLKADSDSSKLVSVECVAQAGFVLNPERYLIPEIDMNDCIALGDVLKAVKRAVPLKAAALDEAVATEETSFKYIRLVDLQDGVIDNKLCCLKELEPKWDKYVLEDGDLVISKITKPCKMAVYRKRKGEFVVMVGNMYALSADQAKLNPYYLQAYLESERGAAALDACSTGSSLPIISVEALKNLQIPVPSMAAQNMIAERCMELVQKITMHRRFLSEAIEQLGRVYEEK